MFKKEPGKEWRGGVYLTTAMNSLEADILESKLRAEGIPCIKRYKGAGNAMEIIMGSTYSYAIELYVPEDTLEDARNIIVAIPILSEDFDDDYFDDYFDDLTDPEDTEKPN
jgi:hypothetical protein